MLLKDTNLPPQGNRIPSSRRSGGTVPAVAALSSNDELTSGLPSSPEVDRTIEELQAFMLRAEQLFKIGFFKVEGSSPECGVDLDAVSLIELTLNAFRVAAYIAAALDVDCIGSRKILRLAKNLLSKHSVWDESIPSGSSLEDTFDAAVRLVDLASGLNDRVDLHRRCKINACRYLLIMEELAGGQRQRTHRVEEARGILAKRGVPWSGGGFACLVSTRGRDIVGTPPKGLKRGAPQDP